MAKQPKPTRAERRAARADVEDARVYGVEIEDAGAQSWISELVFFGADRGARDERLRGVGIHKRVISKFLAEKEIDPAGRRLAFERRTEVFMRQLDDGGWTRWFALPDGYVHPPQGAAAKHPELRLAPLPHDAAASDGFEGDRSGT